MTIEEIKENLGVDITTSCREKYLVYLRTLYANDMYGKKSLNQIGKELNRGHATIIHILKNYEFYKKDTLFNFINEAYIKRDVKVLKDYFKGIEVRRNQYKLIHEEQKLRRITLKSEIKKPKKIVIVKIKRPHILEVAEKLRFVKTQLNNIPYNKWKDEHFKEYEQIIKA